MVRDRERLIYLFGEEALDELDDYDLEAESDVMALVERFLPVPADSVLAGSQSAARTVAVRQILDDDPPETWQAVVRMRLAGLDREEVVSQLSMVMYEHLLNALGTKEPSDPAHLAAALAELPMPSLDELAELLLDVVRSNPGISVDEHVQRALAALGSGASSRILEPQVHHLLDDLIGGPLHLLPDDLTIAFYDTIAERTFTHRLSDFEREIEALTVSVDLAAYGRFDVVRMADGTELDQLSLEHGHLSWSGPEGWLERFQDGDLLAVTAAFDPSVGDEPVEATVTITVVPDEPPMTDTLTAAVRAAYEREHGPHELPVTTEELTLWLCHYHPDLFTSPLPPLSNWCEAAGLELRGNLVAHDESAWRNDLIARRQFKVVDLAPAGKWQEVIGRAIEVLDDPGATIDEVCRSLGECADDEALHVLARVLLPDLLEPDDEFVRDTVEAPGHLFEFVERATAVARRPRERATAEYLACILRERCGQPVIAADHLANAVEAQPGLGTLAERMGWYCFDRGDARGAMQWWRELDELPMAASVIAPFLAPTTGRTKLGRNDPCWCGSGRKFKQCHQGSNELPALPDRVEWLCGKASLWLQHTTDDARRLIVDLIVAWMTGDPEGDPSDLTNDEAMRERYDRAFADPIIYDAALHEGGLFARFLRDRGDLLPEDERLLATAWMTVERSVHEVISVERGVRMTLRDLGTGDVAEVRERTTSQFARVGELYCARVVPDGASHQIVGGIFPVRTGQEQTVLDMCADADPIELCAWAGALAQPPELVHTPGMLDSILDHDAIDAALDELGEADEATVLDRLNMEVSRQLQAHWLDDNIPALGGLTPRQAAADPTRREQLDRLLAEFDRRAERVREYDSAGRPMTYDTAALRRELGLT